MENPDRVVTAVTHQSECLGRNLVLGLRFLADLVHYAGAEVIDSLIDYFPANTPYKIRDRTDKFRGTTARLIRFPHAMKHTHSQD